MQKKYKIGYTTGVFDMFHIGHLNILKRAKEQCEKLIVGVSSDELCFSRKQKYAIINQNDRLEILKAFRYVDEVVLQKDMEKSAAVKKYNVDVVFVGSDWKGTPEWEKYEKEFFKLGCSVVYLNHTDGISSTMLRKKITNE